MNQLIYVETSIPSFYFETRASPDMQVRRQWTRDWSELAKVQDALVTSAVTIAELLETPDKQKREQMTGLLDSVARLPCADDIDTIVDIDPRVLVAEAVRKAAQ